MIARKFLLNNLFYVVITAAFYITIFHTIVFHKTIECVIFAFLCGIYNIYAIKYIISIKNKKFKKTVHNQRETYISTLNHDLKIPTLAQIQALKLLYNEQTGKINKEQKELIGLTLDSCNYMYDMLSTILSTYKYENKDISLCYEKIEVTKIIDECFQKAINQIQNKNLNVRIKAKDQLYTISADRIQIKKAFENLINNCISNADENSELICEIKQQNNLIFLSLKFECPYITINSMQNQFNKYTTSQEKFDKVGTGLGLYLAKQIINAHKGEISVQKNKKNIYNIELPSVKDCKLTALTH